MTVTTAPSSISSAQTTANEERFRSYLLFTLIACLYLLPFMRLIFIGSDEGSLAEGAVRILHGQVFARDFFEVMGPGTFYILAGFFKLFGATFMADRIWLSVTSLGTVMSMYFLSRRVCRKSQFLPPVLLVGLYFSTLWPMVNHHVDSNFFALLSVVCIVLWQDTRRNILLIAAGTGAALTTCIMQPKGMLLLPAFLAWLLIQHRRRSAPLATLGVLLASYSAVIAAVLLYFWRQGALRDLIYVNFIWPSQNYGTVNTIPYARGISQFWTHWLFPIHGIQWGLPLAVVLVLPFLFVTVLPALVIVLGLPQGKDNLRPEILLYWFCGWAVWLSEFHRRDIAHLTAGSPLLIILGVYFLGQYTGRIAELAQQLLSVSACAVAVVNLFIVLSAQSVSTRVGTVAMFHPDPAFTFVETHAAPGTEIFVYPGVPLYYFLSETTNPTRYSLLLYNYNTPSEFKEVVQVLDQHKVRYVVWNMNLEKKSSIYFSEAINRPAGGFILEPYLESHYRVVQDVDGFRILERREDVDAK